MFEFSFFSTDCRWLFVSTKCTLALSLKTLLSVLVRRRRACQGVGVAHAWYVFLSVFNVSCRAESSADSNARALAYTDTHGSGANVQMNGAMTTSPQTLIVTHTTHAHIPLTRTRTRTRTRTVREYKLAQRFLFMTLHAPWIAIMWLMYPFSGTLSTSETFAALARLATDYILHRP